MTTETTAAARGICTNLPSACSHAAARTPLPMKGADSRCPGCGASLLPTASGGGTAAGTGVMRQPGVMAALLGLALLIALGAWWFTRSVESARPVSAATVAAGGALAGITAAATAAAPGGAPASRVVPAAGQQVLRIHGSNTVGAKLAPALLANFLAQQGYPELRQEAGAKPDESRLFARSADGKASVEVQLHAHGTATAFTDLAAGQADVGMASRPIKKDELEATQTLGDLSKAGSEHVIALDGVAVLVHGGNTVPRLSLEQLRGIYTGQISDWSAVGGPAGPIHVLARDDKSGTWDTFKSLVMGKEKLLASARRFEDSAELSDAVSLDPQAIGFAGLPYVRNARAVAISDGSAAPLRPSRFTVATEDYPLSRRLFLYVSPQASELARRFANYAVSDEAQRVADAQGFIGQVPDTAESTAASPAADLPSVYTALTGKASRLSVNLRFVSGGDQLDNKARRDLDRIVKLLEGRARQNERVLLLGFADKTGGDCANTRLSQQRADAVGRELATYGVRPAVVHGFGPVAPVAANDTPAGRERNRRVEVWLTSADVKAPAPVRCE
ncbi:phosphate ABC transporter substrate-binding/OmpA family protein [Leptothrix discophora]|uniref:Phosphate ABC transporter substrate-binding/OmpA family protein n=1 Tax=Leptothrix discophora TaxID=89 RepID=A0ABT9G8X2_LEPDI|nr:phosphate ABC transporter substrate-binding/OmpA family protein [Leptothrix discophora]MDP4302850.1 phosphate ABC transporter substrate-binding/OmpA family protein [Leptothrix discophora]